MAKKSENMAEISNYDLYNIKDLVRHWESGWERLAHIGNRQCPHKLIHLGDKSLSPLERVRWAVMDVFDPGFGLAKNLKVPESIPKYEAVLNLAASSNRKPYSPENVDYTDSILTGSGKRVSLGDWSKDKKKLQKTIEKVLDALASSSTYEEAFLKIAANETNLSRFTDFWSGQDVRWSKGEYLKASIEPRLREMAKWLKVGLHSKRACEEAWWNCLWLYMQPTVETMLQIEKKISSDTPLDKKEVDVLQNYIWHGYLMIGWLPDPDDNDKRKIRLILRPYLRHGLGNPFFVMSAALLIPPTFDLAQKFQSVIRKSRYIKQCRAPSCGKLFYTGVKSATNCPGSNWGKKNKCSLEWNRYRRYIQKIGKNPEEDWNNEDLKKQFIDYDNS